MWNCQSPVDSTRPPRIGDSIDAKSFKEIVKMTFVNKEPKCSELGNEVEGAGQSENRSEILTEPEHQHD